MQKWVSTAPLNSLDGRIWTGHRPPPTGLTVQGSFPVSTWPSSFWYWLDESISTYNAFASLSSLYTKWAGKKEMLVKTNLYLAFSIYGTISVTCQSLGCKIAPPTRDPHFPMTPACQSFMKSKPNFMPSKDQFVNHFACHTSTELSSRDSEENSTSTTILVAGEVVFSWLLDSGPWFFDGCHLGVLSAPKGYSNALPHGFLHLPASNGVLNISCDLNLKLPFLWITRQNCLLRGSSDKVRPTQIISILPYNIT